MELSKSDKERFLTLKIYEEKDRLKEEGEKLVDSILKYPELTDVCIDNFVDNFYYILEEIKFVEQIAKEFKLSIPVLSEELKTLKTKDEICEHFIPNEKFNWKEKREWTNEEIDERNNLVIDIIKRMKREGKI